MASTRPVATYSICACDLDTGQWGVATQSKFLAVGAVVPWAAPHVGAIATQSYANPRYGPDGLALLREGLSAEEVVDRVCVRLGRSGPRATREAGLGPSPEARERFRALGLDDATAEHLGCRHDPETLARFLSEPRARERVDPELPFVWAEVDAAVEAEMAQTLADVMVRRLGLFYESMDQGRTVAPLVAARIAPRLGWTADRVTEEIRAYGALIDDHRRFREDHGR